MDDSNYQDTMLRLVADGQQKQQDGIGQLADRLDSIADTLRDDSGAASDAAVVALDSSQWEALTSTLGETREIGSTSLFLSLVCVCLLSAIMGTRLFAILSDGWRR